MSIAVVYRQGSFHPLEPVEFEEDTRLEIQIFPRNGNGSVAVADRASRVEPPFDPNNVKPDDPWYYHAGGFMGGVPDGFKDPIPEFDDPIGGLGEGDD